ncbi:MAG: PKD domain-containing protein, partial [Chitinophagales bacterium]
PLSYLWNFGDGTTSTAASPSHTYTDFGNYTVGLSVSNIYGCSDLIVYTDYVQINPSLSVDFIPSSTSVCAGGTVSFDNISASASATWLWDFGDGTTSTLFEPTHTYSTDGVYSVSLTGDFGSGCISTIDYPALITVNPTPTAAFVSSDPTSVCALPYTVAYAAVVTGGPVTYAWTFEDATGPGTSSASSPDYTYTSTGVFDVTLTVTNGFGCTATDLETNYVDIGTLTLEADFTPASGCVPFIADFGISAGEELVSYSWDLGNGSISTLANPVAVYTDTGCYAISVTATSINGCTASATFFNYICVGDTSTAYVLLPDTSCPTTALEVLYLPLDSIVVNVDGGLDEAIATSVDSTTFIALTDGDHSLEIITWTYGCPDTTYANIHILDVADSNLVVIYDCANPYQVQFFIDTELAEQSCGWVWNFGDDTEDSVSMNPIHVYDAPGEYSVTITYFCITEEECEGNGLTATVTVPLASFTIGNSLGCTLPFTVNFTNNSTDSAANDLLYFWDFGDGGTSTAASPAYTYNDYGIYPVELLIMDIHDCTDAYYDTIIVSAVTAAYTASDYGGCVPYHFTLNNNSESAFGAIEMFIINWDDGIVDTFYNASDVASITHTFTIEDYYYISLTVVNEYGCSSTFTDTIIASDPFADFSVNDTFPCVGQEIYFNELASGIGLTYFWNFGDGTNSSEANPTHIFNTLGAFTVGLQVTDTNGCTANIIKSLFIETDSAVSDFSANVLVANCNYALIQFNALPEDSVCTYFWEFGDGGTSVEANPIYPYITAGVYSVALTITNCNGCTGYQFADGFVTVPGPFGSVTVSDDTLCVNEEVIFTIQITSADSITLYLDNGDAIGMDVAFSETPVTLEVLYNYNTSGTYFPSIVAVDTSGCFSIITLYDTKSVGQYTLADFYF